MGRILSLYISKPKYKLLFMCEILDKDTNVFKILSYKSVAKRGFVS